MRVCQHCGVSIEGKRAGTMFCSRVCGAASYRDRFPDKVRAIRAANYVKNSDDRKERQRQWNADNAEHRRERDKKYYQKNKMKRQEYQRIWNANNSDRACAYQLEKRLADPESHRAKDRRGTRSRAAEQHMQDALTAIPAIMALINQTEKTND